MMRLVCDGLEKLLAQVAGLLKSSISVSSSAGGGSLLICVRDRSAGFEKHCWRCFSTLAKFSRFGLDSLAATRLGLLTAFASRGEGLIALVIQTGSLSQNQRFLTVFSGLPVTCSWTHYWSQARFAGAQSRAFKGCLFKAGAQATSRWNRD